MSNFAAHDVVPGLIGLTSFQFEAPLIDGQKWGYSLVDHSSAPNSISSLNTCTIQVALPNAMYEIYPTWYVTKIGEDSTGGERIEGSVHWLGPVRVK